MCADDPPGTYERVVIRDAAHAAAVQARLASLFAVRVEAGESWNAVAAFARELNAL